MHDCITQLLDLNENSAFAVELPTDDDLVCIEEELLIPIPTDLEEYLLHASHVQLGRYELVTASDAALHTHLPEMAAMAWEQGLPRVLLPFCEDPHQPEAYFALNEHGEVYHWTPDIWDVENMQPIGSFWGWVEEVWIASVNT